MATCKGWQEREFKEKVQAEEVKIYLELSTSNFGDFHKFTFDSPPSIRDPS